MSRETDPVLSGMSGSIAGYRLEGFIGQGRMAVVYLALDERSGRKAALKVLAPELAGDAAFRARFLHESRACAAVVHPHIIPVYEADEADGSLYLAMQYVQGGDARSLLGQLGPLPPARAWNIISQVASALDAAHAHGLIHRDVKPANMLVDAKDGLDHVYLSDFGMSRQAPPDEFPATGQFAGALDYVAPEQIEGRAVDGRADLYSLACTGFELLCGTPPFGQDQGLTVMYAQLYAPPPTTTVRRPELPSAVDLVLATALAKNPADRYPTCSQFAEELHSALGLVPDKPAISQERSREPGWFEHEPVPISAAPVLTGPGWPPPPQGPPTTPGRVNAPAAGSGPGQAYPAQSPRKPGARPGRKLILTVAAVAVVTAVVVIVVVLVQGPAPARPASSSRGASPAAPSAAVPQASAQAAAVNNLLGSSAAVRKLLQGAVTQARNCASLPGDVQRIRSVVRQRSTEYHQASALLTTALTNGTTVKSDLVAALRDSLQADRDYLAFARQQLSSGCTSAAQSSAYSAAVTADQQAGVSKEAFVRVWNPVAAQYSIPQQTPGSI